MLDTPTIKKIEDFVYSKPRSIQEIAIHLGKNWRTADRYIEEIEKSFGTITTRVFREGTRGALKIVYWASVEKISHSVFQEQLEKDIFQGRKKEDFSAFDIFQYVDEKDKITTIKIGEDETKLTKLSDYTNLLRLAKKQVLFFSGNLSFINFKDKNDDVFKTIEELVKRGIAIKALCRIDMAGIENIKKLLSLNHKYGKELVEVHHREQPLRVTLIDNEIANLKEIKNPTGRDKELNKKVFIFYTIRNKDWVGWLSKIFWKMFSSTINSSTRLNELNKLT
jgi:hypothetical protein